MTIVDVYWTPGVNRLVIVCDCGLILDRPCHYSVVRCQRCGHQQIWHSGDPKGEGTMWDFSEPMAIRLGELKIEHRYA